MNKERPMLPNRNSALVLALAAGAVCATAVAERPADWQEWNAARDSVASAPMPAPAGAGDDLTIHQDLDAFQDATDGWGMVVEDFEDSPRPPVSLGPCDEPLNHLTGQPGTAFIQSCYLPGNVIAGFSVRSTIPQGVGLFAFGDGQNGLDSYKIGTTPGGVGVLVDIFGGPTGVAMDLNDWNSVSPIDVYAYDHDDELIGSFTVAPQSPVESVFAGFTSPRPVKRVEISGSNAGVGLALDNLRFGGGSGSLDIDAGAPRTATGPKPAGTSMTDARLDFGAVAVTGTATAQATVSNSGFLEMTVDAVQEPDSPFALTDDGCAGQALAPGADCTLEFAFAPEYVWDFSARVAIATDGGEAGSVELLGRGVNPQLHVGPGVLAFGEAVPGSQSDPRQLTLVNPSDAPIQVTAFDDPGGVFAAVSDTCGQAPFTLEAGASCQREFAFAPEEFDDYAATVQVVSDSPDSPVSVTLSGRGAAVGGDPDLPYPVPLLGPAGLLLLIAGMWAAGAWRRRRDSFLPHP